MAGSILNQKKPQVSPEVFLIKLLLNYSFSSISFQFFGFVSYLTDPCRSRLTFSWSTSGLE
jgi:hypothetical protein